MGFRNESKEGVEFPFPSSDELKGMQRDRLKHEQTRIRTELAFRISDSGGPDHSKEIEKFRQLLRTIEECLKF